MKAASRRIYIDHLKLDEGPDALSDLLTINADIGRGGNAETHLVAIDPHDGYADVIVDDDRFVEFASQYEHGISPL